jgi:hypothetical protein
VFSKHGKGDARDSHYLSILFTVGLCTDLKSLAAAALDLFSERPRVQAPQGVQIRQLHSAQSRRIILVILFEKRGCGCDFIRPQLFPLG